MQDVNESSNLRDKTLRQFLRMKLAFVTPEVVKRQLRLWYPYDEDYQELCEMIEAQNIDIVIMRLSTKFKWINQLKKLFPNLKIVAEYNATIFDETYSGLLFERFWRYQEARSLSKSDCISVVSSYLGRYLSAFSIINKSKIVVNPNGVDVDMFKPNEIYEKHESRRNMNISGDSFVIGYIGGVEPFRKLPLLISQITDLIKNGFKNLFVVLVIPSKESSEIEDCIRANHKYLDGRIYLTRKWIEHDSIPKILSAFDVCLMPYSNPYGSPLKLFEYLASATPTIAPNTPAVTETFNLEYLPHLASQDGCNLTELILDIYNNYNIYAEKAQQASEYIRENFTWERNVSRIIERLSKRTSE